MGKSDDKTINLTVVLLYNSLLLKLISKRLAPDCMYNELYIINKIYH